MKNSFYQGKNVLITGHTGFKGSWMSLILEMAGANVIGYALKPEVEPNLYTEAEIGKGIKSVEGDIRSYSQLSKVFDEFQPEIVFHLAAQPIVRESYQNPVYTYETNVMGTVNLMECVRMHSCVRSVVNVTTDKVYENREWEWGYRENENLNGYDPHSNSKSCSELVTSCYKKSFFEDMDVRVSTVRAGNVIGGGDFSKDRIIPDCVKAVTHGEKIIVRNPYSIRPYQHVLEPLNVYLKIAERQLEDKKYAGSFNVGPDECDCITTGQLVDLFCRYWGGDASWVDQHTGGPHEAGVLKLDCSRLKQRYEWNPRWHVERAVEETVKWTKAWTHGKNVRNVMEEQIEKFGSIADDK